MRFLMNVLPPSCRPLPLVGSLSAKAPAAHCQSVDGRDAHQNWPCVRGPTVPMLPSNMDSAPPSPEPATKNTPARLCSNPQSRWECCSRMSEYHRA